MMFVPKLGTEQLEMSLEAGSSLLAILWGGYISRIYPGSTQKLDQILGPFWFVYTTESSQDFKKV